MIVWSNQTSRSERSSSRNRSNENKGKRTLTELFANAAANLTSPMILFFLLGIIGASVKSDLLIPESITKALSIYLMMAIGFKGGAELSLTGVTTATLSAVGATLALGLIIPIIAFGLLRKLGGLDPTNAGAIAAHYGSCSVVTFVTAVTFLDRAGAPFDGFMVGLMALMESPGIFMSLLLVQRSLHKDIGQGKQVLSEIAKETLVNPSIFLLFGSLLVGYATGHHGAELTAPFFVTPFYGVLCFFLLEMGIMTGKRIGDFKKVGFRLATFAVFIPAISAILAAFTGALIGLSVGSTHLLVVLAASASYIAAPAAIRLALPTANPAYYLTMSLGITFPLNILLGIPMYYSLAEWCVNLFR